MIYTDQEKTFIIREYKQGRSIQELCAEYGVSQRTIYRWAKVYCAAIQDEERAFTIKDYDMLLRKVTKLENIVTILKTVNCTIHAPLKERLIELDYMGSTMSIPSAKRWMFPVVPFITIFFAISGTTLGSRNVGRNTVL